MTKRLRIYECTVYLCRPSSLGEYLGNRNEITIVDNLDGCMMFITDNFGNINGFHIEEVIN